MSIRGIQMALGEIIRRRNDGPHFSDMMPREQSGFVIPSEFNIPSDVRKAARMGNALVSAKFDGGTPTGWDRGQQLAKDDKIHVRDLKVMRAWFARHGPDAKNGGTSYNGYCKWIRNKMPKKPSARHPKDAYKGAVAWLLWGGDPAYKWLKTEPLRESMQVSFPTLKSAQRATKLRCSAEV